MNIEETRITVRGTKVRTHIRTVHAPRGAHAILTFGEEPVVVTIDPSCLKFAELWIARSVERPLHPTVKEHYEEKANLCLLNGCLLTESKAEKKKLHRYHAEPYKNAFSERDGKWCVVDTHTMSKYDGKNPFAVAVHVEDQATAERVARALNEYEGYPRAQKYVNPQPKPQRRRKKSTRSQHGDKRAGAA